MLTPARREPDNVYPAEFSTPIPQNYPQLSHIIQNSRWSSKHLFPHGSLESHPLSG